MNHLKKIFIASTTLLAIACNNTPKHASIEGEIQNLPNDITEVVLRTQNNVKNIKIENGVFKDTINIDGEFAYLQIGNQGKTLFLNKNTNLVVNVDVNDFQNSISYEGKGKKVNNYLHQREQITQQVFEKIDSLNSLDKDAFTSYIDTMVGKIETLLKDNPNIDPVVSKTEKENLTVFVENLKSQYNTINGVGASLQKGDASPTFNYENYKGGTTNLTDLKGSYVYIDIWATWCPPCKAEIPFLKEVEEKFHKKNIKFVSISVDNPNAKNKWQDMIKDQNMGGIQLFANGDNSFMEAYQVTGIPRFILLDTEGNIVTANAPRPSDPNLTKILKELL
ncbi:TlpA family protein disulfide reductase [Wenyingzhuangia aestuarii]|uniref:TlpA family protein disulfide reductase n=1 Tax=Wenyingzhuangia aestuarii TaxID=1647582 RepID=UPI001FD84372|nr:TlpA disulfide reductase family protein [Wenyingzhuangia aestuarii]NJB82614.1 thiol-disulfide isomerase/thioredoxin [Wenyingzhuangia aestuarii]